VWSAWLPVVSYATLIFTLSSIPTLAPPEGRYPLDKAAHFVEYLVLGGLLVRAWGRQLGTRPGWRIGLALGMGAGIALLDELFQGTVGRNRSGADWATDVLAVTTAVAVDAWERRRRRPPHWLWRRGSAEREGGA
jgi:VanZ family protein